MPAIISHWLHGKRMLPYLIKNKEYESIDQNSFFWGCQGPDVMFYSRLFPWMIGGNYREYGSKLHYDKPSLLFETLARMLSSCQKKDRARLLAYCLGVCCHYSLDRTAHPYVYWLEERQKSCDARGADYHFHGEIESMLDILLLRHETGMLTCDIDLCQCIPKDKAVGRIITRVYKEILADIYDVRMDPYTAGLLMDDMHSCFRFIDDRHQVKRPLIRFAEERVGGKGWISAFMRPLSDSLDYDYANMCHNEWYDPRTDEKKICKDDFIELFEKAVEDAKYMTECFGRVLRGEGSFAEYTGEISF